MLTWLHIGDIHLKSAAGQNVRDLRQIVSDIAALPQGSVDFVLLPGDNADDGTAEQFHLVRNLVAPLNLPLRILPGDHDIASGDLRAFHQVLGARRLPYASIVRGCRCLFLDVVSAGSGGPDFRLGKAQLDWADQEVAEAAAAAQPVVVFMHTYPADLREGADRIGALLAQSHVACVDMGHTHYNELANDGGTIFMATRSTGQTEEGQPGFSLAAMDAGCVSWRFKPMQAPWPFVLITHPADGRLGTALSDRADPHLVRARVLGDEPVMRVTVQLDAGPPLPMEPVPGEDCVWQLRLPTPPACVIVEAWDADGRRDRDRIDPAQPGAPSRNPAADGSDRDSVGAWPAKGIVGGQLGPNRNGRKW